MNNPIIKVKNLYKSFDKVKAVNGISFEVNRQDLFAFIGQNGAGKSTTINMIANLLKPDQGEIELFGLNYEQNANEIKRKIAFVFQDSLLDKLLTVQENLLLRASLFNISKNKALSKIREFAKRFDFEKILNHRYGKLSGGQRRKIDIVNSLISEPEIIFLDEPTTGIDPKARKLIWKLLLQIKEETNLTIFLTTHYLEEVNKANVLAIIDEGEIVICDTPYNIKKQYSRNYIRLFIEESPKIVSFLQKEKLNYAYSGDYYRIYVDEKINLVELITNISKYSLDFEVIKGNIDDSFLNLTNKHGGEYNE